MKKFGLILILVIGAGLAALPYVNGMIMERLALQSIENVNLIYADTGADLKFEMVSYDRGYARTQAEWRIDLGSLENIYGIKEIRFVERAEHGLLSVSSETDLGKNPWFFQWVEKQGANPLSITTQYSLYSPIETRITLDETQVESRGKPLKLGALELVLSIDKELKNVSSRGKWAGISEDENNTMGSLTFESRQRRISNLVWEGEADLTLESFSTEKEGKTLEVSDLSFSFDLSADKEHTHMDMDMAAAAKGIEFNGQDLSGWSLALGVRHMDIQAYETLYTRYSTPVNTAMWQSAEPGMTDEEKAALFSRAMARGRSQLIEGVEKLLKKDLQIQVSDLNMTLPQGEVKGHLFLGLKKNMTLAGFLPLAARPSQAMEIFSLDSRLSFPAVLAKENPGLTAPLLPGMKTGLFIPKGEQLDHRAEIKDNRLFLNGEEVILE